MRLTHSANKEEDLYGNTKLLGSQFIFIEDKEESNLVFKMIELLEDLGFPCSYCPIVDTPYGGTYGDCFTVDNYDFKEFKDFYKKFKKEI